LIDKKEYLLAMEKSPVDSGMIRELINGALTDKIDDREIFLKGIDYSYYYEEL
jgi:cell filamentation protein